MSIMINSRAMGSFASKRRVRQNSLRMTEREILSHTDAACAIVHGARLQLASLRSHIQLEQPLLNLQAMARDLDKLRIEIKTGANTIIVCQSRLIREPVRSASESFERRDAQKKINYATFAIDRCNELICILDARLAQDIADKVATFYFAV